MSGTKHVNILSCGDHRIYFKHMAEHQFKKKIKTSRTLLVSLTPILRYPSHKSDLAEGEFSSICGAHRLSMNNLFWNFFWCKNSCNENCKKVFDEWVRKWCFVYCVNWPFKASLSLKIFSAITLYAIEPHYEFIFRYRNLEPAANYLSRSVVKLVIYTHPPCLFWQTHFSFHSHLSEQFRVSLRVNNVQVYLANQSNL